MRKTGWGLAAAAAGVIVMAVMLAGWMADLRARPAAEDDRPAAAGGGGGPRPGEQCTVYLRGDATGAVYHDRIAAVGNLVSRSGTAVRTDGSWFVLRHDGKEDWIPRTSIALIEVSAGGGVEAPKKEEAGKADDAADAGKEDGGGRDGLDLR